MGSKPEDTRIGELQIEDQALLELLNADVKAEQLASGFEWSEGPVYVPGKRAVLFSDIPKNTIYSWSEDAGLQVYIRPAGYTGTTPPGLEIGTNGLALDREGRLTVADHGNRLIGRWNEQIFTRETLADKYNGKRLNSPNDLVFKSNGDLYFTDPPYGLKGLDKNPLKEQPHNGVYRLQTDGTVTLLIDDLTYPNGIAFSPDEKVLYVAVSDGTAPRWMAYDVNPDGTVTNGRVFADARPWQKQGLSGAPDGLKVDVNGNLFATGPGGIHIFSPEGKHLGLFKTGLATANVAWGGEHFSELYITADSLLLRIPTKTQGHRIWN